MYRAYKYRLYPNKEQQKLILRNISYARFLYNKMLEDSIAYYQEHQKMLNTSPTPYKKKFPWLRDADSLALMNAHQHLRNAFQKFFQEKKTGFPKFKSYKHSKWSYTTNLLNGNIQLTEKKIKLPKIGWVNYRQHRPFQGTLKSVTVSCSKAGRFFVSCLFQLPDILVAPVSIRKAIGLDYSSPELYVDSSGNSPKYPRFYRQSEQKLAKEQRKLSHMQKDSSNWVKQKRKVARLHEHVANQRTDFLQKLSTQIANEYDLVGVEDLNMKSMSQSLHLGKSTLDNGWGEFTTLLKNKLELQGKHFIKVSKWFPSTKTCSHCGNIKPVKLNERIYVCPNCGEVLDRDKNAAINIQQEALRLVNA